MVDPMGSNTHGEAGATWSRNLLSALDGRGFGSLFGLAHFLRRLVSPGHLCSSLSLSRGLMGY